MMTKRFRPQLEELENRLVPTTGFIWQDAQRLTLSFAPDGTDILGTPSQLFQTLSPLSTTLWQSEVLRAFQTWARVANINFALIADSALPFGTAGLPQNDARFGDIRIGTLPLSPDALAVASPADLFAGTWGGDIFLNSNVEFTLEEDSGIQLFAVMLHEIGHALGLKHVEDPVSVMHEFISAAHELADADVVLLQSIYGIRQHDEFELKDGNDDLETAALLTPRHNRTAEPLLAIADITTSTDTDVFAFHTTGNTNGVSVTLKTAGISLLLPHLTVYDAAGAVVVAARKDDHFGGDLELEWASSGSEVFYIKVQAGNADFDIGSYHLQIQLQSQQNDPPSLPEPPPLASPFDRAVFLNPFAGNPDSLTFKEHGVLEGGSDGSFFRMRTPGIEKLAEANNIILTARRTDSTPWQPQVKLFDRFGENIAYETLLSGDGSLTIQLRDAIPNQDYFVQILDDDFTSDLDRAFFLGIDFIADPVDLETFADGAITESESEQHFLEVEGSRLVHFLLFAEGGAVQLTVDDESGASVGELRTAIGSYTSTSIFLAAGRYRLRFETESQTLVGIRYHLSGKRLSDPVGPQLQDLLVDPVFPRPPLADIPPEQPPATAPAAARDPNGSNVGRTPTASVGAIGALPAMPLPVDNASETENAPEPIYDDIDLDNRLNAYPVANVEALAASFSQSGAATPIAGFHLGSHVPSPTVSTIQSREPISIRVRSGLPHEGDVLEEANDPERIAATEWYAGESARSAVFPVAPNYAVPGALPINATVQASPIPPDCSFSLLHVFVVLATAASVAGRMLHIFAFRSTNPCRSSKERQGPALNYR